MPSAKNIMITDLDQSDSQQRPVNEMRQRTHKKQRSKELKVLNTISGNFNHRSRSVECHVMEAKSTATEPTERRKAVTTDAKLHELLKAKDEQLEKLLERVTILHKFNEQFDTENQHLQDVINTLKENLAGVKQQLADCPRCQKLRQQLDSTTNQNQTLTSDVDMMKTLVYRLNVQIDRYQDELRTYKRDANVTIVLKSSLPEWSKQAPPVHTLTPLLEAYDELIIDKEQLIMQYSQEFEHFTGELKRVLEENTRLLRENETLKRDVGSWREERTCLQAKVDVCRAKAEAQIHKTDLAKEKLVEVMHCYEQKTQTLMLDMDHLQAAYARCKSELASVKSAINAQQPDVLATSLQECKELLEQLKQEHSKEKQKLEQQIAELNAQRTECIGKHSNVRHELTKLKQQLDESNELIEELKCKEVGLQRSTERAKRARDRLKARLRIALEWAQKLEAGQVEMQSTYDAVRRLEVVVKHKEAQLRGLHERNLEEMKHLEEKIKRKDATIRTLLRKKLERARSPKMKTKSSVRQSAANISDE